MNRSYLVVLVAVIILILSSAVAGGCATAVGESKQATKAQLIKDISPKEANDLIQKNKTNPNFIIIDVRTPQEFADGHIENAINLDFRSTSFEAEINKLDRNKTYLIYCRSGNRSRGALDMMVKLNFREVYHLLPGIIGWQDDGLPVIK